MSALIDKIRKNSKIEGTAVLAESKIYGHSSETPTPIPMLNVALSGRIDGGLTSGFLAIAGPSKHFKSGFALLMASAYLRDNPEAVILFYDTEFGMPVQYFKIFGIDTNRVIHIPVKNIEELKFDLVKQLDEFKRGEKVCIVIDSIGNIASKKELDDALDEKSVADMTRAKALKALFRMVTPYLNILDIPLIGICHSYQEQKMYGRAVMSGGTGPEYAANTIFMVGRQQEKDGMDLLGYNFVINIEKSRFVKEKSKVPITVEFDKGIKKWSGMLAVAIEAGYVVKPKNGWYAARNPLADELLTGNLREAQTETDEFWETIFSQTDFGDWIKGRYSLGYKQTI